MSGLMSSSDAAVAEFEDWHVVEGFGPEIDAFDAAEAARAQPSPAHGEIEAIFGNLTKTLLDLDSSLDAIERTSIRLDGSSQEPRRPIAEPSGCDGACQECGGPLGGVRAGKRFCSSECSRAFNNRRAGRGAQLYDLFMVWRHDRTLAASLKAWRALCRLCAEWRREDRAERDGRKSWGDPAEILSQKLWLTVERLPRIRGGR